MLGWLFLGLLATTEAVDYTAYITALNALNWTAVDEKIIALLTTSNDSYWPADYNHYGPMMIRLGWHCAGSYRKFDGRGGCDGGRIRFQPEGYWDDNTNLDKARNLLEPIKQFFGLGLSYGDLYIRTATVAIKNMGGPVLGFCAGRYDDMDGTDSLALGPSAEQQANFPCAVNGDCKATEGLGPTTLGLIYVNPEGPNGNGVPADSAPQIRDTFSRMDMNDRETVALIGGGHAFGKAHGACNLTGAAGTPPNWVGICNASGGMGKGLDTSTSGFEGPWTTTPKTWSNQYFTNLNTFTWEQVVGSGGKKQYRNTTAPMAPQVNGVGTVPTMMLNADVSLMTDSNYTAIVGSFASSLATLETEFAAAWYKLTTRDMGPRSRCFSTGSGTYSLPAAQAWQYSLPAPNVASLDYNAIKADLRALLTSNAYPDVTADTVSGGKYYGALFAQLAWQCASTYRRTDYRGGCNGARIQFSPENTWADNMALNTTGLLTMFAAVRAKYAGLSLADAIVLAGHVAVEQATGMQMDFCGGRTDATDGAGSIDLNPLNWTNKSAQFREKANRMGLTLEEMVVLQAIPRTNARGTWQGNYATTAPNTLGTAFFVELIGTGATTNQYDIVIRADADLKAIATTFSTNATKVREVFGVAWNKVMNADFFIGWNGLTCPKLVPAQGVPGAKSGAMSSTVGLGAVVLASLFAFA